LPPIAVGQLQILRLARRYRGQAPSHIDLDWIQGCITNDQIPPLSHKFCAILANRAAYCIELDSHKDFAA